MIKLEVLDSKYNVLGVDSLADTEDDWSLHNKAFVKYMHDVVVPVTRMGQVTYVRVLDSRTGRAWASSVNLSQRHVKAGDNVIFRRDYIRVDRQLEASLRDLDVC